MEDREPTINLSNTEVIDSRGRFASPPRREPSLDIPLSKLARKNIFQGSPEHYKAVQVIAQWNKKRGPDDLRPNDYLRDPKKVEQLRKVLN